MLDIQNLECTRGDRTLIRDLSFRLTAGELLHITGRNGSGKTTLMRTICGLTLPNGGEVRWDDMPIRRLGEDYRRELAYVGHTHGFHGELTTVENLRIHACLSSGQASVIETVLERLGLAPQARLPAKLLSQGQKRRLSLARLLVTDRRLWILDEPFTALDVSSVRLVNDLILAQLARGGMVILTSHQELGLDYDRRTVLDLDR
ncbi:MAG: cytochrome c biogenesis heme-transporting ATPase CcmA [Pseudomonadota bacterium]